MSTITYGHRDRPQLGRVAASLAAAGFVVLGAFELALALGAPLGHAAWGGDAAHLTTGQRIGSAASIVIYAAAAALVLARVGLSSRPRTDRLLKWAPWALAGLFALSALANAASESHWENYLLGPAAAVLAVLCLVIARSPMPPAAPS
jgi:hypothetical protein